MAIENYETYTKNILEMILIIKILNNYYPIYLKISKPWV